MAKSLYLRKSGEILKYGYFQCGIQDGAQDIPAYINWVGDVKIGERINIGLGYALIERLPQGFRFFRFSMRGNINFHADVKKDGVYIAWPHSIERHEDIDPQKPS